MVENTKKEEGTILMDRKLFNMIRFTLDVGAGAAAIIALCVILLAPRQWIIVAVYLVLVHIWLFLLVNDINALTEPDEPTREHDD